MCMVSVRHLKHNGNELQPGYDEEGSSAFVIVILILIIILMWTPPTTQNLHHEVHEDHEGVRDPSLHPSNFVLFVPSW